MSKKDFGVILYSPEQIAQAVRALAQKLNKDYKHQSVIIVGVLNGSFIFMADLVRHLTFIHEVKFLHASSYHGDVISSGSVEIVKIFTLNPQAQVIILEDIVDSGLTISKIIKYIEEFNPKSVRVCTLLNRCKIYRADYIGIEVQTQNFLVGYGLDIDNQFRNFPYIMELVGGDQ